MGKRAKVTITPGIIGYIRCSTEEQATSGLGLDAQRDRIEAECERRGVPLLAVLVDAGVSAKNLDRPALTDALARLERGEGTALMVSKLDRLTRSVHDASGLMMRAERGGWGLVALDVAVDTTTPQGAAMAQVLSVFAELERKLIGERTKAALAVKRSQGVKLGRPVTMADETVARILAERRDGRSYRAIADGLNLDQVATAQGGQRWYPMTVRHVVVAHEAGAA